MAAANSPAAIKPAASSTNIPGQAPAGVGAGVGAGVWVCAGVVVGAGVCVSFATGVGVGVAHGMQVWFTMSPHGQGMGLQLWPTHADSAKQSAFAQHS